MEFKNYHIKVRFFFAQSVISLNHRSLGIVNKIINIE